MRSDKEYVGFNADKGSNEKLEREANRRGVPKSILLREMLAEYLKKVARKAVK